MDTRVLLANMGKRYEAIFNGLGILSQRIDTNTAGLELVYEKLIELDNKLDVIMAHFGLELPSQAEPADNTTTSEPEDSQV